MFYTRGGMKVRFTKDSYKNVTHATFTYVKHITKFVKITISSVNEYIQQF